MVNGLEKICRRYEAVSLTARVKYEISNMKALYGGVSVHLAAVVL